MKLTKKERADILPFPPNAKYTYENGKTDNLMDYSHGVGVERKSLFEWQWETINQKINQ